MYDLLVPAGLLLDLLKEQAIFLGKLGTKPLIENVNDFRQRRFLVFSSARAYLGRTLDRLSISLTQVNGPGVNALQAVVLKVHFVAQSHGDLLAVLGQVRQQEAPIAVEHLQFAITVGNDLTQKTLHLHTPIISVPDLHLFASL